MTNNTKDTNPKDAVGTKKVPISVIPFTVLGELALALLEGARKYGRHNWRVAGVRASVYIDAVIMRHLAPFWEGEDIDRESGLSHITKAIAGLTVLRDSMIQGNWVDDRPPKAPKDWKEDLNKKAAEIIERYPNAKEPYTAIKTTEVAEKPEEIKIVTNTNPFKVGDYVDVVMDGYFGAEEIEWTKNLNPRDMIMVQEVSPFSIRVQGYWCAYQHFDFSKKVPDTDGLMP